MITSLLQKLWRKQVSQLVDYIQYERTIFINWKTKEKKLGFRYRDNTIEFCCDTWETIPRSDFDFLLKAALEDDDLLTALIEAVHDEDWVTIDDTEYPPEAIAPLLKSLIMEEDDER